MYKQVTKVISTIIFLLIFSMFNLPAAAKSSNGEPMLVVTTFSILEDMVLEIGGNKVQVVSLIARKADAHTFEPSPITVKKVSDVKLLVSNGLGFETWLSRLLQSSNFKGKHVVASSGINALSFSTADHDDHGADENSHDIHQGHDDNQEHNDNDHHGHVHNGLDPHAWQDVKNGIIYAQNIAKAMGEVDIANQDYYLERANIYIEKLSLAEKQIKEKINSITPENRNAVTAHDAFAYFAKAYDVNFMSAAGISTQAEPSAKEIAKLIQLSAGLSKVAFFVEFGTNPRMIKQLAKETGVTVGEHLYSDTLDDTDHSAGSYLGMMLWNANQLSKTLQ